MRAPQLRRLLGFDDRPFTALGIPVMGLLIPLVFGGHRMSDGYGYWIDAAFSTGYAGLYWLVARAVMLRLHRRYPQPEELRQRVAGLAAVMVPFILVICGLSHLLLPDDPQFTQPFYQTVLMSALLTALVATIYESVYLLSRLRDIQIEREQLLREKIQTELEALRHQVNPHFLFNSLNALADLIHEDADRAERYVQELSRVYRYVLEIQRRELIRLQEELDFLDSYLYLLRTRFGDKLQVDLDIPDALRHRWIVPLTLQLLFENAIKHNVVSAARPLRVTVQAEGDRLVVRNNLQVRPHPEPSTGKGLDNLRNRYRLLGERVIEAAATAAEFRVSVPTLGAEGPA
jgi:LytS/YehU family sensor histidine kinase